MFFGKIVYILVKVDSIFYKVKIFKLIPRWLIKVKAPSDLDVWVIAVLVLISILNLVVNYLQNSLFLFYAWLVYVLSRVPATEVQRSRVKALHFGLLIGFIVFIIYFFMFPLLLIGFTSLIHDQPSIGSPLEGNPSPLIISLLAWNIYTLIFLSVFNLYKSVVQEAQIVWGWLFLVLSIAWIAFLIMIGIAL